MSGQLAVFLDHTALHRERAEMLIQGLSFTYNLVLSLSPFISDLKWHMRKGEVREKIV